MRQWEVRKLPNSRTLFVHQHDWHIQLYVSGYKKGVAHAKLLGRDTLEGFVASAVTALDCPEFERQLKFRYRALKRLKAIRLNFGFSTLVVTKASIENAKNPVQLILTTIQGSPNCSPDG